MMQSIHRSIVILSLFCFQVPLISCSTDVLSFLLLGDWGKGGTSGAYTTSFGKYQDDDSVKTSAQNQQLYQVPIAKSMATYAQSTDPKPSFILALGDNFYKNGVSSTTHISWDYLWKDVYLPYSELNIPWYPIFGNHDYGGSTQAQIDRTYQHTNDDIWTFPASNYTRRFPIPGGGVVQVIFIDTTTLAPSQNKLTNENGGISKEVQAERINNQIAHITRMLDETLEDPPTWLLVAGHYPIYSAGEHSDMSELLTYLLPLLQSYKVHAYLCGHDHISEHLSKDGIEYFVAGAGSMTSTLGKYSSAADLVWSGVGYSAFAAMRASIHSLQISYFNTDNQEVYSYSLTNPNPYIPPRPPHVPGDDDNGMYGPIDRKEDDSLGSDPLDPRERFSPIGLPRGSSFSSSLSLLQSYLKKESVADTLIAVAALGVVFVGFIYSRASLREEREDEDGLTLLSQPSPSWRIDHNQMDKPLRYTPYNLPPQGSFSPSKNNPQDYRGRSKPHNLDVEETGDTGGYQQRRSLSPSFPPPFSPSLQQPRSSPKYMGERDLRPLDRFSPQTQPQPQPRGPYSPQSSNPYPPHFSPPHQSFSPMNSQNRPLRSTPFTSPSTSTSRPPSPFPPAYVLPSSDQPLSSTSSVSSSSLNSRESLLPTAPPSLPPPPHLPPVPKPSSAQYSSLPSAQSLSSFSSLSDGEGDTHLRRRKRGPSHPVPFSHSIPNSIPSINRTRALSPGSIPNLHPQTQGSVQPQRQAQGQIQGQGQEPLRGLQRGPTSRRGPDSDSGAGNGRHPGGSIGNGLGGQGGRDRVSFFGGHSRSASM